VSRVHDVAIVGGGPVGMLLAVQLARAGRDVLVIEERTEIAPRPRAIGIHPPAVEALAEASVDVSAHGRPIVEGVAMADGRVLGRLPLDGVVALAQQDVERMLRARLASLAPDALVLGRRVRSVHGGPDGDRVLTDDRDVRHTARLVVGADGVRSVVRAAAGVGMPARGATAHYLMADVDDDGGVGDRAILCFEREGVVESFPLPGGRRRWVALVPRPREDADFAEFAAIVHDRTGHELRAAAAVWPFTVRQALARSMVADGVVLIGDAAHAISPIGGQGLNLGWLEARALTRTLLSTNDLERFNRERLRSARQASAQAAFNMGMGRALPAALHAGRSLAIRALAAPPLASRLADAFTMRTL
jgi:2-polyprenyl-6-methoxyphenol hydroxylase-like FAD-dependent oxidoreductase